MVITFQVLNRNTKVTFSSISVYYICTTRAKQDPFCPVVEEKSHGNYMVLLLQALVSDITVTFSGFLPLS